MPSGRSTERRNAARQQIEHMLAERRQLFALLLQASNLDADSMEPQDEELLVEFCEMLVDYIAAGHFGLYERIAKGRERRQDVANIAKNIYPQIEQSTQQALAFSEKYSAGNKNIHANLTNDLSSLGMILAVRIDLEDQLIARILGS
jgi:regulator of sigma D